MPLPTPEVTPEPETPKETTPPVAGEKPKVQKQGANTGADALAGAGILASLAGALGLGGFAAKRRAGRKDS